MRKLLLALIAAAVLTPPVSAQDVPTLSQFLSRCFREGLVCRIKMKDYVNAAVSQKSICLPKDVTVSEASEEILSWLRDDHAHPASLEDAAYDDALYAAAVKLYPCAPPQQDLQLPQP